MKPSRMAKWVILCFLVSALLWSQEEKPAPPAQENPASDDLQAGDDVLQDLLGDETSKPAVKPAEQDKESGDKPKPKPQATEDVLELDFGDKVPDVPEVKKNVPEPSKKPLDSSPEISEPVETARSLPALKAEIKHDALELKPPEAEEKKAKEEQAKKDTAKKQDKKKAKKEQVDEWDAGEDLVQEPGEEDVTQGQEFVDEELGIELPEAVQRELDQGSDPVEGALREKADEGSKFKIFDPLGSLREMYAEDVLANELRISMYYRSQYFSHYQPDHKRLFQNEFTMRLEFTPKVGPLEFHVIPEINIDDFRSADGFYAMNHLDDNGSRRSNVGLYEAYVATHVGPFDMSFGKRIYSWGAAFGPNPTDNLNAEDIIDPIEGANINNSRKIGSYSAYIKCSFPSWGVIEFPTIEAVFIPRFTRDREAFANSRWYLNFFPDQTTEVKMPDNTIENSQWALRYSMVVKGFDISVSYYSGVNHNGYFRVIDDFTIEQFYDNVHILGMDWVTTVGAFKFFFEATHVWSKKREQDDFFKIAAGIEFYYNGAFCNDDQLIISSEMFLDPVVSREVEDPYLFKQADEFTSRGTVFSINYQYRQNWSFVYSKVISYTKQYAWTGDFHEFKIGYKVTPNFVVSMKAQLFNGLGGGHSLYGSYAKNDTVFLILDYTF